MTDAAVKTYADFVIPASVVTKLDVSRLVTEVEKVDNEMTSGEVRAKIGQSGVTQPVLSEQLTEFLQQNQLMLGGSQSRSDLIKQLHKLKDMAPMIHMTFSVTADRESLEQLAQWLRSSVHPQAVIDVGLQPALVAGVYVRTPNHIHDLSLRAKLDGSRDLLTKELEAIRVGK